VKALLFLTIFVTTFAAHAEFVNTPYSIHYFTLADNKEKHARELQEVKRFMTEASNKGWKVTANFAATHDWKLVQKKVGQSLESILEKTEGCIEWTTAECLQMVRAVNRNTELLNLDSKGEISVPVKMVTLDITIDAGAAYREEVIGNTTMAEISRDLAELEYTIIRNTYPNRTSKFCSNVDDTKTCSYFRLKIVD